MSLTAAILVTCLEDRIVTRFECALLALACLGMMQGNVLAEAPSRAVAPSSAPQVLDVQLGPGGTLTGQLVDPQGRVVPGSPVILSSKGLQAEARTDHRGVFVFTRLRRGLYVVSAGNSDAVCRVWERTAAPPSAGQGILLVYHGQAVRGQGPLCESIKCVGKHPLLTGAIIATAIVVPIVAVNESKPSSP
jgi:hypothetical protein